MACSRKAFAEKNSFTDFLSAADFLLERKLVKQENFVVEGGSAGGLIMGYIANNAPSKFRAILMSLPFLHVYRDSQKPQLLLTSHEKCEWGDVANQDEAAYIKSYCPYENIRKQDYPAMLIHHGLYDNHVPYWNTLKYVKKLRDHHTGSNPIILSYLNLGHACDITAEVEKLVFLKSIFGDKLNFKIP